MTHDALLTGIKEIERLAEGMWGTTALRAVVELHKIDADKCKNCELIHCYFCEERYPCPTIQAIEEQLA